MPTKKLSQSTTRKSPSKGVRKIRPARLAARKGKTIQKRTKK